MRPRPVLPPARYFAMTWGIDDDYGGMTTALLHRSKAFEALAGRPVEILTFDTRPDYPQREEELRAAGKLLPGSRVINIWDWLRDYELPPDAPGSLDLERHPFTPLQPHSGLRSTYRSGHELTRTRYADNGDILQVDHYRLNGSLLLSDRRDTAEYGTLGMRSVVMCDFAGSPVRSWGGSWALYRYWLDRLRGGIHSIIIVDSKTTADFMIGYRRKKALTVHIVHGSHLADDGTSPGELRPSRRRTMENLAGFDAVAVLTERQGDDIQALLGASPNIVVMPNSIDLGSSGRERGQRPPGQGIVIASLTERKRVEHAIDAAVAASRMTSGQLTLDIFGDGEEREQLANRLEEHNAHHVVRFHGHRTDARSRLATASFLLLTSRSEGSPLVLAESMAAGCIPIAYDIPYGPADLIEHGRNGFLVPAGDVNALTEAILALQRMAPRHVRRLRGNARKTARSFTDSAVVERWGRELHLAACRKLGEVPRQFRRP
ncbi:MAG: hypothetical protein JWQ59_1763 [Cryobacterium sp.]|nr:hypothetical protein [Cryobacterium sp.]